MTIDDLADELDELRAAHRALAAQHLALMTVFRVIAPILSLREDPAARLLIAYDTNNALMDEHGHDDDSQAQVREWMDVLNEALTGAGKSTPPPNRTAG